MSEYLNKEHQDSASKPDYSHYEDPVLSRPSDVEQILMTLAAFTFIYGFFACSTTLHSFFRDIIRPASFLTLELTFTQNPLIGKWSINPACIGVIVGPMLWKRKRLAWLLTTGLFSWAFVQSLFSLVRTIINPYENNDAAYTFIPISMALALSVFLLIATTACLLPSLRKLIKS